uniref:Retrovirus-related Pol polyprotein from transposon TNT 1-94 n=1 Tax=Tanacetum cinerariifolium TaxID=118510 RepID=A0A6L2L5X9_TANCI|nr:retrovirus-related Pol polyprotein from transposon TNT 1-94 [Tanacetum cinerariifolium]
MPSRRPKILNRSSTQIEFPTQEDQIRRYRAMTRGMYQAANATRRVFGRNNLTLESVVDPKRQLELSRERRANLVLIEVLYSNNKSTARHRVYQHYSKQRILCVNDNQTNLPLYNQQSYQSLKAPGLQHIHLGIFMIRNTVSLYVPDMVLSVDDFHNHVEVSIQIHGYDTWQGATTTPVEEIAATGWGDEFSDDEHTTKKVTILDESIEEGVPVGSAGIGAISVGTRETTLGRGLKLGVVTDFEVFSLRGSALVEVILVKGYVFPTIVKVRPVGCDLLALVELFILVEGNRELTKQEKLQDDCDVQAINIILQGLPPDVYSLITHCQGEGHMARQFTKPKRPRSSAWFKEKMLLVQAQESGQVLDEEQLAFLADPWIPDGQCDNNDSSSSRLKISYKIDKDQVAQEKVKKAFKNADSSSRVELIPSKIKYAIKVVLNFHKEFSVFSSFTRKENDGLLQDQVFKNKEEVVIKVT